MAPKKQKVFIGKILPPNAVVGGVKIDLPKLDAGAFIYVHGQVILDVDEITLFPSRLEKMK